MYTTEAIKYNHANISGWVGWINWWEGNEPVIKVSCGSIHQTPAAAIADAIAKLERIESIEKKQPASWNAGRLRYQV